MGLVWQFFGVATLKDITNIFIWNIVAKEYIVGIKIPNQGNPNQPSEEQKLENQRLKCKLPTLEGAVMEL